MGRRTKKANGTLYRKTKASTKVKSYSMTKKKSPIKGHKCNCTTPSACASKEVLEARRESKCPQRKSKGSMKGYTIKGGHKRPTKKGAGMTKKGVAI